MSTSDDDMKKRLSKIVQRELIDEDRKRDMANFAKIMSEQMAENEDSKSGDPDRKGRRTKHWDRVASEGKNAANPQEIKAFEDWRASTSHLVAMYAILNQAIHADVEGLALQAKFMAQQALDQGVNVLKDDVIQPLKDKFGFEPENVALPKLGYNVSMDDDGKLNFARLERNDRSDSNDPKYNEINDEFQNQVTHWLALNGYDQQQPGGTFINRDDGTPLNKDQFEILKGEMGAGMKLYLEQSTGLEYQQVERPIPRPS